MISRTDKHRNPTAFTTDIAAQAGLKLGVDYQTGDPFEANGKTYYTAHLLGDPVALTIRTIDTIGFFAGGGGQRWSYIGIPKEVWLSLTPDFKQGVIAGMYNREGGSVMTSLFNRRFIF